MSSYNLSAQVALLTEHFQHTPIALIDEIINTINTLLNSGIDDLENYLLNEPADRLGFPLPPLPETDADGKILLDEASENEIRTGVHKLETLLESAIDRNFDRFELYVLRNILTVPEDLVEWIRLAHHKGLDFHPSPSFDPSSTDPSLAYYHPTHPTNETLRLLRQRLIASHHVNQTLKTDLETNAVLIQRLKSILGQPTTTTARDPTTAEDASSSSLQQCEPLKFLTTHSITPPSLLPLSTTTAFVASQISSIRSLLASIEPKLLSTPSLLAPEDQKATPSSAPLPTQEEIDSLTDLDPDNANISPDEKRKRYIEKMTRRHMQKQRRLKLTRRGEVVGGEYWEGGGEGSALDGPGEGGRRRLLEEVQALEGLFGGGAAAGAASGAGSEAAGK